MSTRAFSTLGCPGASPEELLELARAGGCDGVELRCAPGEAAAPDTGAAAAAALSAALTAGGVEVVCLASYVRVADPSPGTAADLRARLHLAAALGAPLVRVFTGEVGEPGDRAARAARALAAAAPEAEDLGVDIALETHDALLTGAEIAGVLAAVGSPAVGALWDAVNPWRAGEEIERTADLLAPWLRHVQLKDVAAPTDLRPVLPGRGAVPIGAVLDALPRIGYTGPLSLEWERAWYPEAAPLADALTAFGALLDARAAG